MKAGARRQRGIALLFVIAMITMGGTWYMISRLNRLSLNHSAIDRRNNAEVLGKAKQALIGYVIAQANKPGENNPGALPCPEAPGSFNDAAGNDGKVNSAGCSLPAVGRFPWRTIGTDKFVDAAGEPLWYVVSPGWAITGVGTNTVINSNSVGQLSMDGVSYTTQAAGDTVVALLIAPGPAMYTTCNGTGVNQVRSPTANVAPDWKNYLECENATNPADSNFVTTSSSGSFNDQVVKVTVADIMPGIEAAVADRMQREIDPVLKTFYGWSTGSTGSAWGRTTLSAAINSSQTSLTVASTSGMPTISVASPNFRVLVDTELMAVTNVSGTTLTVTRGYETSAAATHSSGATLTFGGYSAIYPYAATFSDPSSSAMQGTAGTYKGLLPLNYAEASPGSGTLCTAGSGAPRCSPSFVAWNNSGISVSKTGGGGTLTSQSCSTSGGGAQLSCSITFSPPFCLGVLNQTCANAITVAITATANNVGMAMRQLVTDPSTRVSSSLSSPTAQATINNAGAAQTTVTGSLGCQLTSLLFGSVYTCGASSTSTVTIPITLFADHPLTYSLDANYGWFTRNKWHELTYYAIASNFSPSIMPSQPTCTNQTLPVHAAGGSECLGASNVTPLGQQRALLILAGRGISGGVRTTIDAVNNVAKPSTTVSDYLEFGNATGSYEKQTVSRANAPSLKKPFNDRVIAVDSN